MAGDIAEGKKWPNFKIPGATVRFRKSRVPFSFGFFSEPCDLLSISIGGLVFDSDKKLVPGTKVELRLLIPDHAPINLLGRIRWDSYIAGKTTGAVVVHFIPFCSWRGNPNAVLEVLRELEVQYAKDVSIAGFNPVRDHLF
jgi:PilZ domain